MVLVELENSVMKIRNILKKTALFGSLVISFVMAQAQDKAGVKSLIESKRFTFKVQTVLPISGSITQATGEYEIRLYGDSLISYLPYFGRAYSAPMPGESGGFNFTSTKFEYKIKVKKKYRFNFLPFCSKKLE